MLRSEIDNIEELSILNAKLQKDYSKLLKKLPKKELTEKEEKIVESLTLGDKKNDRVIMGSLAIPAAPIAIGVGKAAVGLIALIPSLAGAPTEEAASFFDKARTFSENTVSSGASNIADGISLLAIPAGVVALSVSMRIYKNLKEKRINEAKYTNAVVKLIDDVLDKKEDPSLEFISKFIKKVDLSGNDSKTNLNLLKYMAYYRYMLKQQQEGNATYEEVEEAYNYIILYLKTIKETDKVTENFKNNRLVNILIMDFDEKYNNEEIIEEAPTK